MKQLVKLSTMAMLCLFFVACQTTRQMSKAYEEKTIAKERADTVIERDSVLIFVSQKTDTVKVVQREVRERERVKVQHDTVTVVKTDTVRLTTHRNGSSATALSKLKIGIKVVFAVFTTIIILSIIIKIKKLCHRLI